MNLMQQIANASQQMESAARIRAAVGSALTPEQQLAVSSKVASGPEQFIAWAHTDEGRATIRLVADRFVAAK